MRRPLLPALAAMAAALAALPAAARDLPVPPDKGWQHAATGLILRRTLLGLPRTRLTDSTDGEWDVAAQFNDPALATSATVYVFHAAVPDAALWFDRAEYELEHRASFGSAAPAAPATPFAPPGSRVASGLRRTYRPTHGDRSTALAVMPLGPWLVAVRLSSTTLDPAALDGRLTSLIGELGWPTDVPDRPAPAAPVAACPTHLAWQHAQPVKAATEQLLLNSVIAGVVAEHATGRPAAADATAAPPALPWCREGAGTVEYGAYRHPTQSDGYTLAIGDAGRSIAVYPAIALPPDTAHDISVRLDDVDGNNATFGGFDALPEPAQVFDDVRNSSPAARTSGDAAHPTVTISTDRGR